MFYVFFGQKNETELYVIRTKTRNDLQRPTTTYNDLQRSTTTYIQLLKTIYVK